MADNKTTKDKDTTRSYSGTPSKRTPYEQQGRGTALTRPATGSMYTSGSPFGIMRRFAEDMDRMMRDFGFGTGSMLMDPWSGLTQGEQSLWSPQVETFRRGDQLIIRADLPGMNKENVNVELQDDMLIISGERQDEYNEERDDFYRSERSYGRFYRTVPLPEGVESNQCNAQFKDGVLEVTLPAPKESRTERKRIDIK
jgi:HSP20 family protein